MELLASTVGGEWRPGIGDPTVIGWFTVVCYFTAAWLCWKAWHNERKVGTPALRPGFWLMLAILMVLLGFNKQLDLQTYVTIFGRQAAARQGWYGQRMQVQAAFIGAVALAALISVLAVFWSLRGRLRRYGLAAIGVGYLAAFVVIRAASFHHVDRMLNMSWGDLRMNHVLEVGGIACIGACAWRAAKTAPRAN